MVRGLRFRVRVVLVFMVRVVRVRVLGFGF